MAKPEKPKAVPLMSTIAREGFVIVEVGPERKQYHLHKALLMHHSEYFRNAFSRPWKEATDRVVTLEDVEPLTFGVFVNWVYTKALPTGIAELKRLEGYAEDDSLDDDYPYVTEMVKSYVFGDRYLAQGFRRAVKNELVNNIIDYPWPSWFFATIYAFGNLSEDDAMLDFLVDVNCRYWYNRAAEFGLDAKFEDGLRAQLPSSFWIRLMNKYSEKVREKPTTWWVKDLKACDYHEHGSDEERKECAGKG